MTGVLLGRVGTAADLRAAVDRYGVVGGVEGALSEGASLELSREPWRTAVVDLGEGSRELSVIAPRPGGGQYRVTLYDGRRGGTPFEATADVPVPGRGDLVALDDPLARGLLASLGDVAEQAGDALERRGLALPVALLAGGAVLYAVAAVARPVALVALVGGGLLLLKDLRG